MEFEVLHNIDLFLFIYFSRGYRERDIRKTCPCNVYPLEPYFYIVKLGFAGVNLFFLFLLQNIDCGYSLEPPQGGGSNVYPQSMFVLSKNNNNIKKNFNRNFSFFTNLKISVYCVGMFS